MPNVNTHVNYYLKLLWAAAQVLALALRQELDKERAKQCIAL
jgi:hypothetical protein